jgi:hypothetical protein
MNEIDFYPEYEELPMAIATKRQRYPKSLVEKLSKPEPKQNKTEEEELQERKEQRIQLNHERNRKDQYRMFVDGVFNCDAIPWGFNYHLGYCEKSNNFTGD